MSFLRLTAALLLLGSFPALAQELWTIQTVAYPDYRQAQSDQEQLLAAGFDSYIEFTMNAGIQYSRVRVGCFDSRFAAESLAGLLAGNFVAEAIVQPFTPGAEPAYCVRDSIGFIKPPVWSVQAQDERHIIFRVQLGGHSGYVRMWDGEWQLLTEIEPVSVTPAGRVFTFEQVTLGNQQVIVARLGGGRRYVCNGRLIWQSGRTAVVERGSTVAACVLEDPSYAGGAS